MATRGSIEELLSAATGEHKPSLPPSVRRVVLSQPARGNDTAKKLSVRPVLLRGAPAWQFEWQRGPQAVHENLDDRAAHTRLCEAAENFKQILVRLATSETQGRRDRGPDWAWSTRPFEDEGAKAATNHTEAARTESIRAESHDRRREYPIPEGTPAPFLVEIGVATPEGKIRRDRHDKFRQINRFLEFVRDVLPSLPAEGTLEVVDFGCGKSYLTFALHHYLTAVLGREVRITGIDRKESVVAECARLGETLGCRGLSFQAGEIAGHAHPHPVDLAISLHACDTASDDALIAATRWQSKVILAVPCCQHELASQITLEGAEALLRHGILRERFGSLATDALRAEWLETRGYSARVVEFIDTEHTPKNLLIRAIRRDRADGRDEQRQKRYRQFKEFLGLSETYLDRTGST